MLSPSLVPGADGKLYFVLCDYGPKIGKSFYEADPEKSDRETVIRWMVQGQYTNPEQVIEVDLDAGTARDVTAEIMNEVERRAYA